MGTASSLPSGLLRGRVLDVYDRRADGTSPDVLVTVQAEHASEPVVVLFSVTHDADLTDRAGNLRVSDQVAIDFRFIAGAGVEHHGRGLTAQDATDGTTH